MMQKLLMFLIFFPIAIFSSPQYRLSVCAIFYDEAPYLDEWVSYHKHVGVEHFWLYNNESTDNYLEVLQPWIDKGIVEVIDWPDLDIPGFWGYITQPAAYRDALTKSSGKTTWLAIIDLDEFIVPMKRDSIAETLKKEYKNATAIYVNWLQFGTGGITTGPGKILNFLTSCAKRSNVWNTIGKSIVRPDAVVSCIDPHFCIMKQPFEYFNGDGQMNLDYCHHEELLRINHYTFRDEWYFWNVKVPRCIGWGSTEAELVQKNWDFSVENDTRMINIISSMDKNH